jgi:alpha-L-fucosidase
VLDIERGKQGEIRTLPWQTDDAIGNQSWGYTTTNTFKDARYVVTNLIDIVSKNGNLLLNIGPKSDGTITDEETQVLLGTGKWLDVNGAAIYGTRPWKVYGEGPTKSASGSFADQKEPFTWRDVRFTTKGDTLFVTALGLPDAKLAIKALGLKAGNGKISGIKMLGSGQKVSWQQKDDALIIDPAKSYPCEYAVSYAVEFVH